MNAKISDLSGIPERSYKPKTDLLLIVPFSNKKTFPYLVIYFSSLLRFLFFLALGGVLLVLMVAYFVNRFIL